MNWLRNQLTALLTACALTCTALVSPVAATPVGGNLLQNSYIPPNNSVFVPCTYVAGYTAWYNPTTIQHTGSVVTAWNDASANGRNISTAHNSPAYSAAGGPNGLPSVHLTAASSMYLSSATVLLSALATTTAYTIYAVYQISSYTGASNAATASSGGIFSDQTVTTSIAQATGSTHLLAGQTLSADVIDAGAISTGITVITEQYYDGTNMHFRVNGVDGTPLTVGSLTFGATGFNIGASEGSNHFFDGYISELIFYNTTLSSGNRTTMRTCIGTKYNGTG